MPHNSRRIALANFIALIAIACATTNTPAQDSALKFTGVDGETFDGTLESISEDGVVEGKNLPDGLTLDGLRQISSAAEVSSDKPRLIVHLSGGDLFADGITAADDQCKVRSAIGEFELGVESIRGVRLNPEKSLDSFDRAMKNPKEATDQLFVELDGRYQRLEGLLESIDASNITFEFQGESRELPIDRIYGFVMAGIGEQPDRKVNATLLLKNGSRLVGRIKSMNDGKLNMNVGLFADLLIPIESVGRINVRSSRLQFLSDLEPVEVEQKSLIVSVKRPWQRDRSIEGNSLTLFAESAATKKVFTKGLGTHAGCRLVFQNDGKFNQLAMTIGIDVETNRNGDCLFVVSGDGKELLSQRMKGTDDGRAVEVDISDVDQVTLEVLPGEGFDLGDHANWCDARFLKTDD